MEQRSQRGFTLIELSIVLVVIGLIVGGVLTGQSLIAAAGVRAQISQIEAYNTAVNTFSVKYGYLPGDIKDPDASKFGFVPRGPNPGEGDGNGFIEGYANGNFGGIQNCGVYQTPGEPAVFWSDLSAAHMIAGNFTFASATGDWGGYSFVPSIYLPPAKLGANNYVYVYAAGILGPGKWVSSANFFGLSAVGGVNYQLYSSPGLTVSQAYAIDKKTDDGLPQTGRVLAIYEDQNVFNYVPAFGWASSGGITGYTPYTTATPGSATTCFDNGNTAGVQQTYSLTQNNGNGVNCALSFRFQAGD